MILLDERLTHAQWSGIALYLAGVAIYADLAAATDALLREAG